MAFIYPKDLIPVIKDSWKKHQDTLIFSKKDIEVPFPSTANLEYILDVLYHVSFLTEESRKVSVTTAYFEPINCDIEKALNGNGPPIVFDNPVKFSVSEVLRLSPALDPKNTMLLICPEKCINLDYNSNELVIWGILYLGNEYINLLKGRATVARVPPNILRISTFSAGDLTITTYGKLLAGIHEGKLVEPSFSIDNREGIVGRALYQEVCSNLVNTDYDEDNKYNNYLSYIYFRTLLSILRLTKEKLHGGTFLIVPSQLSTEDTILSNSLNVKYSIQSSNMWKYINDESIAKIKWNNFSKKTEETFDDYKQQVKWENKRKNAQKKLFEFEEFISSLTEVDGAVLLNSKLEVLGFGAEITVSTPNINYIKEASDLNGKSYKDIPINSFGTRHRSAIRFCSHIKDSIAFVISQDGSIKVIKKEGDSLFLWKNINVGERSE
ncbi:hypothetical protein CN964_29970 [Bacillus cereus]|uniref:putative sensor domain DACNV-containing protein n=1 Tax=Bacillus cereus TaxID=1396 RepID=UPI000BF6782C|nr:diadenylate cyclase [Bacillus cereus]PFJ29347.1 hypothetical protein COI90_23795 [Bacillus cereus]PFO23556.1 hypothetical protein COJ80_17280 [Bacillus cereus]PGN66016.1 hypothetical protein CN964_29970 [Bacillus cereus]